MLTNLTQNRLKQLLDYDQETGYFVWLIDRRGGSSAGMSAGYARQTGRNKCYLNIRIDGVSYKAHRLAWLFVYGCFPENQIDHINGNSLDNSIINLRCATSKENRKNNKVYANNAIGCAGVSWCKDRKNWLSRIQINYKQINLGRFNNLLDAASARISAENKYNFNNRR